jgi:hypothetical protein
LARITGAKGPSLSRAAQSDNAALALEETLNNQYRSENFNDFVNSQYDVSYPLKSYELQEKSVKEDGEAAASMINRYVLFQYKGLTGGAIKVEDYRNHPGSRFVNDPQYKLAMIPTTTNIIQYFNDLKDNISMVYSYADFIYCKYHGKIPNNYMLTLRRFHLPIMDDIISPKTYDFKSKQTVDTRQPDLARAVTWMSEITGNKLEEIIKFNTELKFKEVESEMQVLQSKAQGIQGSSILGAGTTGFGLGSAISSVATLGSGTTSAGGRETSANGGFDATASTYPNFVEGPLYVIKRIMIKDSGIYCAPEFKLTFHYNLKSYGNINPKIAFLDILSNFLVLTYNAAPFWGGATRYVGNGTFGKPMGDHSLLAAGDLGGFVNSLMKDAGGMISKIFGDGAGGFNVDSIIGGAGKVAGDMLGGWLSKNFNTPQGAQGAAAFLSGSPTGNWHLTIGNPLNPIAMVGNLVLTTADYKFIGPLGKDDFPTQLEIVVTLKSGRDRDKGDIENMFNAGRGRLYQVPEGMEDFTNVSGKQPPVVTAYSKLPAPNEGNGFSSNSVQNRAAASAGHNPAANNSGPDTIWGATKEVYDVQSVKVTNSEGGKWLSSKFQNVSAATSANLHRFSNAVNHG